MPRCLTDAFVWQSAHLIFILTAILQTTLGVEHFASFYGDSFIKVPVKDASSKTDIKLHFRTAQKDGLLLLAAGSVDYCIVSLQAGAIVIHFELGSGESSLSTRPGLKFDDLRWHSIHLTRSQGAVRLNVDNSHISDVMMPGRFSELNIDRDVLAGGTGNDDQFAFFSNYRPYRGCMRDIQFNGASVLGIAKARTNSSIARDVTWNCSLEFEAESDRAISFMSNSSFMLFNHSFSTNRALRLGFEIRTRSVNAQIILNSKNTPDSNFLAVEVVNQRLRLHAGKGSTAVVLNSGMLISDGTWHQVEVVVESATLQVAVDGTWKETRFDFLSMSLTDLSRLFYLGGVQTLTTNKPLNSTLSSGSFVGCFQNFKIGGTFLGFREAIASKYLKPDCSWSDPCQRNPCDTGFICEIVAFDIFHCVKERNYSTPSTDVLPANEFLEVHDLLVSEGGRSVVGTGNIKVKSHQQPTVGRISVSFKVVHPPANGEIFVNTNGIHQSNGIEFTTADLLNNKVVYIHDDSEETIDAIGFEATVMSSKGQLIQKVGFTLMVRISPNNDKPSLILPADDTLWLITNTQVRITSKILNVSDSDDIPGNLEYTVHYQQGMDGGYFELADGLGSKIKLTKFTQASVMDGRLRFVHRGPASQQVTLQVFDGKDHSDLKILKVHALPIEIRPVLNTGLVIPHRSIRGITRENLTFATNAPYQDIELRYEITVHPLEGKLQRQQLYSDGQWVPVTTSFTQKHIDRGRLRYVHESTSTTNLDFFRFKVSAMGHQLQEYEFKIQIIETRVEIVRSTGLRLRGEREGVITSEQLQAVSTVPYHSTDDIVYSLIATPRNGHMFRSERRSPSKIQKRKLQFESNFTQSEINEGKISYKLQKALFSSIHDDFEFKVYIPGAESNIAVFELTYEPIEGDLKFINNGLVDVFEGESKAITTEDLYTEKIGVRNFRYSVLEGLSHGQLQLVDPKTGATLQQRISSFTNDDIRDQKVYYVHDNSESEEDSFSFTSTPVLDQSPVATQEITELSGMFDIKIILRNDNPPIRHVEKEFNVVANRGRIITPNDIWYIDPDINYDSAKLEYSWLNITNGEIVLTGNHSVPVYRFTQQDLVDGRLYFRHFGSSHNRSVIWITDGHFFSTGILEVHASDPFVRANELTNLTVEKGKSIVFMPSHFNVQTNLDAEDKSIRFVISEPPLNGFIKKNNEEKHLFNMADIKNGLVSYEHNNSESLSDDFKFTARIEGFQAHGMVKIRVLMDGQQHPPRVVNNRVAVLDEFDQLTFTPDLLNISHPFARFSDILFTVTNKPHHGRLISSDSMEKVQTFTQEDINLGRLQYEHQDEGQLSDVFQFDVQCGVSLLAGLEFVFDIVPSVIPMEVRNITVQEAGSVHITKDMIVVRNKFFQDQNLEFFIVNEPKYGRIETTDFPGVKISQFAMERILERKIIFVHDGSENTVDEFTMIAKSLARGKQSELTTVGVAVLSVNDQPPRIVINKKLDVWTGSETPIDREHLLAEDDDTNPDEIFYQVLSSSKGEVVLAGATTTRKLTNFTQGQINRLQVVFLLKGAETGSFMFHVTDGVATTNPMSFEVESKSFVLTMENNRPLYAFPNLTQAILPEHLKAATNDASHNWPIIYTIQVRPSKGRLVTSGIDGLQEVKSFTQDEIHNKTIRYEHTGASDAWTQKDMFVFEVKTVYAPSLTQQTFEIFVSFNNINNDNRGQLMTLGHVEVDAGRSVDIGTRKLDVSRLRNRLLNTGLRNVELSYLLIELPRNGLLKISRENATVGYRLAQSEIDRGQLRYVHDHSETVADEFVFGIVIRASMAGDDVENQSHPLSFPIVVRQPFTLKTSSPGIQVIQGSSCNITKRALETVDLDTPPENLVYEIRSPPSNGHVVKSDSPTEAIMKFSQRDINENKIIFIQDGSPENGVFWFSVSDGREKSSLYKVFNISVVELTLDVVNGSKLELLQGQVSATLSKSNLDVRSNGNRDRIFYNITKSTAYGELYYRNKVEVLHFSQNDIDNGWITYLQTDLSSATDAFEFIIYDIHNLVRGRKMDIIVKPNLKKGRTPLRAAPGESFEITTKDLDASDLAITTDSNPVYYVVQAPVHGVLRRVVPSTRLSREAVRKKGRNKDARKKKGDNGESYLKNSVFNFTHNDIVNRQIEYSPAAQQLKQFVEKDRFRFVLTAKNSQPVSDSLDIEVYQSLGAIDKPMADVPNEIEVEVSTASTAYVPVETRPVKDESASGSHGLSPATHMVIVFLVCAIVIAFIIALIVYKCMRWRQRRKRELAVLKEDSKSPLADASNAAFSPTEALPASPGVDAAQLPQKPNNLVNPVAPVPVISVTPDTPETKRRSIPAASNRDDIGAKAADSPSAASSSQSSASKSAPAATISASTPVRPIQARVIPSGRVAPTAPPPTQTVNTDSVDQPPTANSSNSSTPPKKDQVVFDWDNVDPELLQHCRKTTPVLHTNQYWV